MTALSVSHSLWTIRYSYLSGVKGKIFSSEKKDHFLDYAEDCDEDVVEDAKYVYPLIVMFVPMIFFWAMFDMKGSKWVLTGTQVNVHNLRYISYVKLREHFRQMVGLVVMLLKSSQIRFNLQTRL